MRRATELWALFTLVACAPPSPERIELETAEGRPPSRLAEGDLLVVDARPTDGSDAMNLCVDASSSSSDVVRVSRVRGQCRRFVVVASAAGTARVRFEVRGTVSELDLDVTPVR